MRKFSMVLALIISLFTGAQAVAHARLIESTPADGSMLMQQVPAIELQFSAPVRLMKISVRGKTSGELDINFKPSAERAQKFSVKTPALAVDNYEVYWVAMGADGHKMSGSFQFMQHQAN